MTHYNLEMTDTKTPEEKYTKGNDNLGYVGELDVDKETNSNNVTESSHAVETKGNCWTVAVARSQRFVSDSFERNSNILKTALLIILILLYFAYFGYSIYYSFGDEPSYRLVVGTAIACVIITWNIVSDSFPGVRKVFSVCCYAVLSKKRLTAAIGWILAIGVTVAVLVYVILDVALDSPRNLISMGGMLTFVLVFYITSLDPAMVNWRPVFWGIAMQYVFALLILRTQWGYDVFQWCGDRVTEFIDCADAGAEFVFGTAYTKHFFAFRVMPIVVFFCSIISILYYLGVMQSIVRTIGRFLAFSLGTTPAESLNVAGNMFVSQSEALAMISPFLADMTKSELHAALTGGFASVSGSTLGAYISLGVPANHLLSATVMSAPAAFAMSKLTCPETEISKASSKDFYRIGTQKVHNVIEAAYLGASQSIKLVANICINVMAFLAILKFLNNTLTWFGDRAGVDNLTFEYICSYVMYPVAFLMGADGHNCRKVAELIGVKTFLNEFIAYESLGKLIENRAHFDNYTSIYNTTTSWYSNGDDLVLTHWNKTLEGGILSLRSETIATYALCGFSNIGSIGINLGAVLAFAPNRKVDAPRLIVRAMIAGSAACFLTGAVAGLLYKEL